MIAGRKRRNKNEKEEERNGEKRRERKKRKRRTAWYSQVESNWPSTKQLSTKQFNTPVSRGLAEDNGGNYETTAIVCRLGSAFCRHFSKERGNHSGSSNFAEKQAGEVPLAY